MNLRMVESKTLANTDTIHDGLKVFKSEVRPDPFVVAHHLYVFQLLVVIFFYIVRKES